MNGQILVDAADNESYALMYDAGGRVVARYRQLPNYAGGGTQAYVFHTAYDLRGNKTLEFHGEVLGSAYPTGGVAKAFVYDSQGVRLQQTLSYFGAGAARELAYDPDSGRTPILDISGWLQGAESYTYDGHGRLLSIKTRVRVDFRPSASAALVGCNNRRAIRLG